MIKDRISVIKDDSFFMTDNPDADPVQIVDILKVIPFGKFHWILITMYTIMMLSTSILSFNFAFFLMPQAYLCPVINSGNQLTNLQSSDEI